MPCCEHVLGLQFEACLSASESDPEAIEPGPDQMGKLSERTKQTI